MPLYYDGNFACALVCISVSMIILAFYGESFWPWKYWPLLLTSYSIPSIYCLISLLWPFCHEWRQPPVVQLNNAAPANGNAAQQHRDRLRHVPDSPGMLTDVFQCLPRVGLDACQLVSRQFRDAVEDARTALPLYPMVVALRSFGILVHYTISIVHVGFVTGHFFMSLRRCDSPYIRNAAIVLHSRSATWATTSTDMISAFVRRLNLNERNIHFTELQCNVYAGELENLFRFADRHNIDGLGVIYKRSLVTPGCDFLSRVFAEARKRPLRRLLVSLASAKAENCDTELQVGFQVLSEIFQDQKRPSSKGLGVIVPRLKGFRLLQRIFQAYARGEITRPLTIGCDSSVSLAELWPENSVVVGEEHSASKGPAIMKLTAHGDINFYQFSVRC
ncbi:hypothetical protein AAVH_25962 [Aphelenchoides avenae]|nr:hypothetical protein AAVH_25962 [Aphelenchus avenae]